MNDAQKAKTHGALASFLFPLFDRLKALQASFPQIAEDVMRAPFLPETNNY